jgi:hypothetical protein
MQQLQSAFGVLADQRSTFRGKAGRRGKVRGSKYVVKLGHLAILTKTNQRAGAGTLVTRP